MMGNKIRSSGKKCVLSCVFFLLMIFVSLPVSAASSYPTVYKGVNYKKVYDYNYYIKKYPSVAKSLKYDKQKVLQYYVVNHLGKNVCRPACANFSPGWYFLRYKDLRRKYGYDWKKYVYAYMNDKGAHPNGTYTNQMSGYRTTYMGKDYKAIYDLNYVVKTYKDVFEMYGWDENNVLKYYVAVLAPKGKSGKKGVTPEVTKKTAAKNKKWKRYPEAYAVLQTIGKDLRKAYNWSASLKYYGHNEWAKRNRNGDVTFFALYGFERKKGPCQTMNGTFYQMATELGYKARVIKGGVRVSGRTYWGSYKKNGKWYNTHYWVEINHNGTWYLYDPNYTNEMHGDAFKTRYGRNHWTYSADAVVEKNY